MIMQKAGRGLRRKISKALKTNKFFFAIGWINQDEPPQWHIETLDFPRRALYVIQEGILKFIAEEAKRLGPIETALSAKDKTEGGEDDKNKTDRRSEKMG